MSFQAFGDFVALKREQPTKVSKGGIVIPQSAVEKVNIGEVVSVGEFANWDVLEVGTKVVFQSYSGIDIEVDGEKLTVVKDEHILGVIH